VASINGAQRGFMPPMTRELAASIADHRSPFPSHNPSIRHRASVKVGTARYILCRNEAEAERERIKRRAIIAGFAKLGEPVVLLRSTQLTVRLSPPAAAALPQDAPVAPIDR